MKSARYSKRRSASETAQRIGERGIGAGEQHRVFIEEREGVTHAAARRTDTERIDLRSLTRVQRSLDARLREPHQAVEKVVKIVARRHAAGLRDMAFVRRAVRQIVLRDEGERRAAAGRVGGGGSVIVQCAQIGGVAVELNCAWA